MAKYDVVHVETGETKVVDVSVHEIMQWYEDNPEWRTRLVSGLCFFR